MTVCFEFLNNEPLDNMVTFLNYKFDKVVFFGSAAAISNERAYTERFLKKYCDVLRVEFSILPEDNLQEILKLMQASINKEVEASNEVYFDVTGGESLILVAFGILSEKNDTPMHKINVLTNECIDIQSGSARHITKNVPARRIKLTVDKFIEMRGGVVNYDVHKAFKDPASPSFRENVEAIWKVFHKHTDTWNHFSMFFRDNFHPDDDLWVSEKTTTIKNALKKASEKLQSNEEFHHILNEMIQHGLITDYSRDNDRYTFRLKDEFVKDCIWDSGSILEFYTYLMLNDQSDSCAVAAHLDWDGVIHVCSGIDVINEVDVLSIKDNIPTFTSCKTGMPGKDALYELDAVTRRFGGKYARKMLAVTRDIMEIDKLRADEMNIEIYKV